MAEQKKMKLNYKLTFLIGFGFMASSIAWSVYNAYVPPILDEMLSAYIEKATVNNETMHVPERVVSFEPAINGFDVAAFLDGRLPGTDDDVLQSEIM